MKQIDKFINEKLVINKDISIDKYAYKIETEDELIEALEDLLDNTEEDQFQKYIDKAIKNHYKIYHDKFGKIYTYFLSNSYDKTVGQGFALRDLMTILKMEGCFDEGSEIYYKYLSSKTFAEEITRKLCTYLRNK